MALRSKEERGGGSGGAAGAGGDGGAAGADARGGSPCGGGLIEMDETFYELVYVQVRKVPAGSVCTYGDIAALAGYPGAAREVGLAMSRVQRAWNLPCHRIVNAKGTLAPSCAFGGKHRKRIERVEEPMNDVVAPLSKMHREFPNERSWLGSRGNGNDRNTELQKRVRIFVAKTFVDKQGEIVLGKGQMG